MATVNLNLSEELQEFVNSQVETGQLNLVVDSGDNI